MNALRRRLECRAVRSAIEAGLDGEASPHAGRVAAHLERCPGCRAWAEALAAQARAIAALPAEAEPPVGFVGRVMERIEAVSAPAGRPAWRPSLVAVSGAAAGVLAAVALWVCFVRPPAPVTPTAPVQTSPRIAQAPEPQAEPAARQPRMAAVATVPEPPAKIAPPARGVRPRRRVSAPPVPGATATAASSPAPEYRETGRSYESEGDLEQALAAYAAARDEGGSQMARLDVARVYEKSGYTAQALDELVQVAFSEVDEKRWETLTVQ